MSNPKVSSSKQIGRNIAVVTLVLLGALILWLTYRTGLLLTWGSAVAGIGVMVILPMWCIWVALASYLCLRRATGIAQIAGRVLLCIIIAGGSLAGLGALALHLATSTRNREIQVAIDNGLYADCIALLNHWPAKGSHIFLGEQPLPKSIVLFEAIYITNDSVAYPGVWPANIGLCKNGFGGFADGVRVFRNDEDARKCMELRGASGRRIAPGIYYWHEST